MFNGRLLARELASRAPVSGCAAVAVMVAAYALNAGEAAAVQAAVIAFGLYWVCWLAGFAFARLRKAPFTAAGYSAGKLIIILIAMLICVVASERFGYGLVPPPAIFTAVFSCLLKALYSHMEGVDHTLDTVSQFSTQPVTAIRRHNNYIIGAFILLAAATAALVLTLVSSETLNGWIAALGDALLALIRRLLGNMPDPAESVAAEPAGQVAPDPAAMLQEEPSLFMQILGWIMRSYFTILTIIGALTAGYLIYIWLKGFRFKKRAVTLDNGDVSEAVAPDPGRNVFTRFLFGARLPSNPVRRAFYKKINKHRDMVTRSDTASEMAERIKAREDIGKLAEDYQEVRYFGGIK